MGLDGAAATTRGILTASGLVSVKLSASDIENIRAILWGGGGKAQPVVVFIGVPSFAGNSVKNNFVTSSNWCAGAGILSGVFSDHSCLHGFPFSGLV
jgi:hypothetical protein